jgi:peptide/nickel transport system ATP-binding protein
MTVAGLKKHYTLAGGLFGRRNARVLAVDGVDFVLNRGETLGLVGESGCGKSTIARLLMQLVTPDCGSISLDGVSTDAGNTNELRRHVQMVFQDSYASLNPRMTIEKNISFGLRAHGVSTTEAKDRVASVLQSVGLDPREYAQRYPHELSGGQRQRVNIARAIAMEPRVLILDEAVSALDKSVEAQILNVLQKLKSSMRLTFLFISHDLGIIQYISDRVLVMYLGKVVELGPVEAIYNFPKHPYTRALLSSRLSMNPRQRMNQPPIEGDPPNPINPPSGCRFRTRCPIEEQICAAREPLLTHVGALQVACHAYVPGSGHTIAGSPKTPAEQS